MKVSDGDDGWMGWDGRGCVSFFFALLGLRANVDVFYWDRRLALGECARVHNI